MTALRLCRGRSGSSLKQPQGGSGSIQGGERRCLERCYLNKNEEENIGKREKKLEGPSLGNRRKDQRKKKGRVEIYPLPCTRNAGRPWGRGGVRQRESIVVTGYRRSYPRRKKKKRRYSHRSEKGKGKTDKAGAPTLAEKNNLPQTV